MPFSPFVINGIAIEKKKLALVLNSHSPSIRQTKIYHYILSLAFVFHIDAEKKKHRFCSIRIVGSECQKY